MKIYDIKEDDYYLYTCAQLKAREKEFIEKTKLERMINSKSIDDLYKVFSETVYSYLVDDIKEGNDFKVVNTCVYKDIFKFLSQRLKSEHLAIIDLLFMEEYIHNIKVIYKSQVLGTDLKDHYLELFDPYGLIISAIQSGSYRDVSPLSSELVQKALKLKDEAKGMEAELELEKYYMERLFKLVDKLESTILTDYLKHKIDIMNIKNINRSRFVGLDIKFEAFLLPNGFIEKNFFKAQEDENSDYFVQSLQESDYEGIVRRGINSLFTYNTFASFEKNEDAFYLDFFDGLKYTVTNVEKIFYFFLRKKIELEVLNIIFSGVLYDIDKSRLRHRAEVLDEN